MTLPMKPLPDRPELTELLRKSKEIVDAMTPEQRREMHIAQRKSWVIGEMMLEHLEMTREEAEAIYERVISHQ
jgi:hypothetical protein